MPPIGLSLSGTPLNEALISLHTILPQFKKENGVQKVQCVVMTDGEANWVKYHAELQRRWEEEPFIGVRSVSSLVSSVTVNLEPLTVLTVSGMSLLIFFSVTLRIVLLM